MRSKAVLARHLLKNKTHLSSALCVHGGLEKTSAERAYIQAAAYTSLTLTAASYRGTGRAARSACRR